MKDDKPKHRSFRLTPEEPKYQGTAWEKLQQFGVDYCDSRSDDQSGVWTAEKLEQLKAWLKSKFGK